jgi:hypothetical protein
MSTRTPRTPRDGRTPRNPPESRRDHLIFAADGLRLCSDLLRRVADHLVLAQNVDLAEQVQKLSDAVRTADLALATRELNL